MTYGAAMAINPPSPTLTLEYVRGSLYRLRNTGGSATTIESIENKDDFFRIDLKPGTQLDAGRSTDFIIAGANGKPVPGEILVRAEGVPSPVVVPIPLR